MTEWANSVQRLAEVRAMLEASERVGGSGGMAGRIKRLRAEIARLEQLTSR